MSEPSRPTAHLVAGPYDGVAVTLPMAEGDLPHAVVLAFAVEEPGSTLAWHSYALDQGRASFRYLGEHRDPLDEAAGVLRPVVAGAGVTREFYDVLFERHPEFRSMFPADLDHQSELLRAAFTAVLGHLDDSDWLTTRLGALGARHAEWGVTPAMYDAFCDCMVTAMATQADDRWTVEEEHLWQGILEDISRIMLAGAAADG